MKEKKRFSLSLYMDSPIQRETWAVLQSLPFGQRTDFICRAVCRMRDEKHMLEVVRSMLREELRDTMPKQIETPEPIQNTDDAMNDDVRNFLLALQNSDDG